MLIVVLNFEVIIVLVVFKLFDFLKIKIFKGFKIKRILFRVERLLRIRKVKSGLLLKMGLFFKGGVLIK